MVAAPFPVTPLSEYRSTQSFDFGEDMHGARDQLSFANDFTMRRTDVE
jgi:hypothetical protein